MGGFLDIVLMNSLIKIKEHDYMAMQTWSLTQKRRHTRVSVTSSWDFTIAVDFISRHSDGTVMDGSMKPEERWIDMIKCLLASSQYLFLILSGPNPHMICCYHF